MSTDPIQALTQQLQAMSDMAAGQVSAPASAKTLDDGSDFQSVLRKAVLEVNAAQNTAQAKVQAFSTGESNMTLEEVMVSSKGQSVVSDDDCGAQPPGGRLQGSHEPPGVSSDTTSSSLPSTS